MGNLFVTELIQLHWFNYIFGKTNYHKIENSLCFQNLHKSGAAKKYLGYKLFEILYLQNSIAFTCCAMSFKTIDRFYLKNSQSGGLNVKSRWLVEIVSCLFSNDLGWIDFGSIIILSACGTNETFFFSIKFTQQI